MAAQRVPERGGLRSLRYSGARGHVLYPDRLAGAAPTPEGEDLCAVHVGEGGSACRLLP